MGVAPDRRARRLRRFLLGAITAGGVVVALELILQSASWFIPTVAVLLSHEGQVPVEYRVGDEVLGYRPSPAHVDHDRRGFRNRTAVQHARIVALGDSQTYGTGVEPDEAWPQQLGASTGAVTYNMAFGGYGPTHSLVLLDEALSLSPEVVIEGFYAGNDLWDSYHMVHELRQLPELRSDDPELMRQIDEANRLDPLKARVETLTRIYGQGTVSEPQDNSTGRRVLGAGRTLLSEHSKVYGVVRAVRRELAAQKERGKAESWAPLMEKAGSSAGQWEAFESAAGFRTIFVPQYRDAVLDWGDVRIREGHRLALAAIERMHERVRSFGAKFLVVLIPTKELVFEDMVAGAARSKHFSALLEHEKQMWEQTKTTLTAAGIEFVDALPVLKARLIRGEQPYPQSQDGHPNAAGQGAIAQLVADWLAHR